MLDSSPVLTKPSAAKQPILGDTAMDSSSSSHQSRAEIRRQYRRRIEKSRLLAAVSYNNSPIINDVEKRQSVASYDNLVVASTSDTEALTNMTSTDERTRTQSLQSLDESISVPTAKTFPLPDNSVHERPQSPILPPKPQRSRDDRRNSVRTPPPSKPPSSAKIKLSPRPSKPKFKRSSSSYLSTASSNVVDDALMDRAFFIRENLRKYEMQELAAEAERAAESGLEKFVGSASKYVEESPDQTPRYIERKQVDEYFMHDMVTPQKTRGLLELDQLEFTPSSYFNSNNNMKKIKVSALRRFSDVVPNFSDMHSNIRFHLQRNGVDVNVLPEMVSRAPIVKNDTIESDTFSQAPSVTGSIGSFGSYAASSIKGVAELLGRSRSNPNNRVVPGDLSLLNQSSSAISSFEGEGSTKPPTEEDDGIVDKPASDDLIMSKRPPPLFPPSVQMARSIDMGGSRTNRVASRRIPPLFTSKSDTNNLEADSYDSDDSSVELYGRKSKSPMNMSLDEVGNKDNSFPPTLTRSRSAHAFPSFDSLRQGTPNVNASFEDPMACRSCSPEMPVLKKGQTKESIDDTGTVLSLLDKIQRKFSVSLDEFRGDGFRNPKKTEEENKMFVSNYFYTEKNVKSRDNPNLKIDINHLSQSTADDKAFCVGNCSKDDIKFVSSCETLGKFVTSALNWVNTKNSDTTEFVNRSESVAAISNIYTDTGHDRETRVFAPPRLSERCKDTAIFASDDNDIRQPSNQVIPDCSEMIVCDGGFDTKKENDKHLE